MTEKPTDTPPASPFSDALKRTPQENARDAERLYDAPDREEVTETARPDERRPSDPATGIARDNPPG